MSKVGKSSRGRARQTPAKKASPKKPSARKASKRQLRLPEVLDLTAAGPLAQSFLSHRGAELKVDASRVRRVGAQCLQVYLAAAATWKADGARFSLAKPSPEFLEGGRLLGIRLDQDLAARESA